MEAYRTKRDALPDFRIRLFLITLGFFMASVFFVHQAEKLVIQQAVRQYAGIAQQYSHSLRKSGEAREALESLLKERMHSVAWSLGDTPEALSAGELDETAKNWDIYLIDVFSDEGLLLASNNSRRVGWNVPAEHPLKAFLAGEEDQQLPNILRDDLSGMRMQVGFFRLPQGRVIQVGILADTMEEFLEGFDLRQILQEMRTEEGLAVAVYAASDGKVTNSAPVLLEGRNLPVINRFIAEDPLAVQGGIGNSFGTKLFQVFIPVIAEGQRVGTLGVGLSADPILHKVTQVRVAGGLGLFLLFGLTLYFSQRIHRQRRHKLDQFSRDPGTGLYHSQTLRKVLPRKLQGSKEKPKALLLLTSPQVKMVNMILGYEAGEAVLRDMGQKLALRQSATLIPYRFTTDSFVLYAENYGDRTALEEEAHYLIGELSQPYRLKNSLKSLDLHIGIAEQGPEEQSLETLLQEAAVALHSLSGTDSSGFAFYGREMAIKLQRLADVEGALQGALAGNPEMDFHLVYQPLYSLKEDRIMGFEALARLRSPMLGTVPPEEFIQLAEKTQLIVPLGLKVLREALAFLGGLTPEERKGLIMAVNISVLQLIREEFPQQVQTALAQAGLSPNQLELEITESVLYENYDLVNRNLGSLRKLGIRISLDDFGTGYSSLHRLKELQVDTLKIDRSFIGVIHDEFETRIITKDIIAMAHQLGLTVVAEGVEEPRQMEYLRMNRCDVLQGYLFSGPLKEKEAKALLQANPKCVG